MDAPAVTVRKCALTPEVERALTHEASRSCLEALIREVHAGIAEVWECRHGADVLHVVTRVDHSPPNPPEWVMCLAVGRGVKNFLPMALDFCRRRGWGLRIHTESEAMAKLLKRSGGRIAEFVLRW